MAETNEREQPTAVRDADSGSDALVTLLMLGAAAIGVGGFGVLFSMWWSSGIDNQYEVLRVASQEFVRGRPVVAGELAETVQLVKAASPSEDAAPDDADEEKPPTPEEIAAAEKLAEWNRLRDFLIGAGKVSRAAETLEPRQRRNLHHAAIPFLESARAAGFPPGRQAQGLRLLGETLFEIGRFKEATEVLQAAIESDPVWENELLPVLAEAQLHSAKPNTEQSLANIERFLQVALPKGARRHDAELLRIRALVDLQRWSDAADAIEQELRAELTGPPQRQQKEVKFRHELRLLRATLQILLAKDRFGEQPADEFEDRSATIVMLSDTMEELSELQREASPKTAAQARLWAARAFRIQGRIEDALAQLTIVRQQRPFGAEGVVAGLEEIEMLARLGRGLEMLQTTRFLMRELGDDRGYDGSLVPFVEFRRRMLGALDEMRSGEQFAHAIDAARSLPPVFPRSESLIQEGLAYRDWGEATIANGTDIGGEVARSAALLARDRFRASGDAFAEAAQIQFDTSQYLPTLWSAIEAYQKGRHFTRSIELLEPYLRYEERRRQPRGLISYGRALLAVGKAEKAIDSLKACVIEFPRDPLRYDARLLAAQGHAELGDLDGARDLLTENLQDGELTPRSPAWRDSLLTLGELLYRRAYENHLLADRATGSEKAELLRTNQPILEEAVRRLDEGVIRYWPLPRAEAAAYLAARSHVLASQWPRYEAQSPEILDAAKRTLRAQADAELMSALEGFTRLRRHLVQREEEHRLPESEQAMLRNCFLAEADTLHEMSRLEDAATTYRAVSLRFMNEPPALEAILGQARCVERLGRKREADMLVRQAGVILQRIPNEWNGRFEETTRFDRDGWEKLLTWMNDRLDNMAGGV